MGQQIEPVFEEVYSNLDKESRESLLLYAEFLLMLQRKKEPSTNPEKKKKKAFLSGLAHIPIPVDNVNIDRADIYGDRF
ncbi:MAG: hypothetical protein IT258_19230 [Saprospiraceae bacterium]|nr:hypothetical protein [Saprospiraceae bacterium]